DEIGLLRRRDRPVAELGDHSLHECDSALRLDVVEPDEARPAGERSRSLVARDRPGREQVVQKRIEARADEAAERRLLHGLPIESSGDLFGECTRVLEERASHELNLLPQGESASASALLWTRRCVTAPGRPSCKS